MSLLNNLNGPSAPDGPKSDYLTKERQAAEELLKIQSKNAQQLAALRAKLLKDLQSEAITQGKTTEEYLAQYGLQQRLQTIKDEAAARQQAGVSQFDQLAKLQKQNETKLKASELKLYQDRQKKLKTEQAAQKKHQADLAALELSSIEERAKFEADARASALASVEDATREQLAEIAKVAQDSLASVGQLELPTLPEVSVGIESLPETATLTPIIESIPDQEAQLKLKPELGAIEVPSTSITLLPEVEPIEGQQALLNLLPEAEPVEDQVAILNLLPEVEPIEDQQALLKLTPEVETIVDPQAKIILTPEILPIADLETAVKGNLEIEAPESKELELIPRLQEINVPETSVNVIPEVNLTLPESLAAVVDLQPNVKPIETLEESINLTPELGPIEVPSTNVEVIPEIKSELPPISLTTEPVTAEVTAEPLSVEAEVLPIVKDIEKLTGEAEITPSISDLPNLNAELNLTPNLPAISTEGDVTLEPTILDLNTIEAEADVSAKVEVEEIPTLDTTLNVVPKVEPINDLEGKAIINPIVETLPNVEGMATLTPVVEPLEDLTADINLKPQVESLHDFEADLSLTPIVEDINIPDVDLNVTPLVGPIEPLNVEVEATVKTTLEEIKDLTGEALIKPVVEDLDTLELNAVVKPELVEPVEVTPEISPIETLEAVAHITADTADIGILDIPAKVNLDTTGLETPSLDLSSTAVEQQQLLEAGKLTELEVLKIRRSGLQEAYLQEQAITTYRVAAENSISQSRLSSLDALSIRVNELHQFIESISRVEPISFQSPSTTESTAPVSTTVPQENVEEEESQDIDFSSFTLATEEAVKAITQASEAATQKTLTAATEAGAALASASSDAAQTSIGAINTAAQDALKALSETDAVDKAVQAALDSIDEKVDAAKVGAEKMNSLVSQLIGEQTKQRHDAIKEAAKEQLKTNDEIQAAWLVTQLKGEEEYYKQRAIDQNKLNEEAVVHSNALLMAYGHSVEEVQLANRLAAEGIDGILNDVDIRTAEQLKVLEEKNAADAAAAADQAVLAAKTEAGDGVEIDEAEIRRRVEAEYDLRFLLAKKNIEDTATAEKDAVLKLDSDKKKADAAAEKQRAKKEADQKKQRLKDIAKTVEYEYKLTEKLEQKGIKGKAAALAKALDTVGNIFSKDNTDAVAQILEANPGMSQEEAEEAAYQAKSDMAQQAYDAAMNKVSGWLDQLAQDGEKVAAHQTPVDTRLQGLSKKESEGGIKQTLWSYWRTLENHINSRIGISPLIKQEDAMASIEKLVKSGIAFNLEERAFLETISSKIADTFETTDATLLKLVRIQQADSTAARLGMESALTSFLNAMYATSEYMSAAADSIRQNLFATTSLLDAKEATEFEYQVQKWMGSLYSVGFTKVEDLSETLGKLVAGDIESITNGGLGNLLIMAANQAGMSVAEILQKGLSVEDTNKLLKHTVNYLGKIYSETKNSRVVAQQFANVYGVTMTDLRAAANLSASIDQIANVNQTYGTMLGQLHDMANSIYFRTSTGDLFQNALDNFSLNMAATLVNNPVLSSLHTIANMLNDLVGGIEIPFINVWGFGFDLNATIADLMNVAALSGTVLGGIGKLIASLASGGGFSGSGMLKAFGVDKGENAIDIIPRGNAPSTATNSGASVSESGMVGNESGDDIKNKTMKDASEGPESTVAEAKEEQDAKDDARTQLLAGHIVEIYDLLQEVVLGTKKLHVQLEIGQNPLSWQSPAWYR